MKMSIDFHEYGKSAVRLMKVFRGDDKHVIRDLEVQVLTSGNFDCAFEAADNSTTVPTDTVKNNIMVSAHELLTGSIEEYGLALADWFFGRYADMQSLNITIRESGWDRIETPSGPHAHSFLAAPNGKAVVKLKGTRDSLALSSGIEDLFVLKSTGSGFVNFPKCDLTSLPEVDDRILATKIASTWTYSTPPADYVATRKAVLDASLTIFAENYSPSVQSTIYEMAEAVFKVVPEVETINYRLPNVHYVTYPLERFDRTNGNTLFYPTGDPYGDISATVKRD